MGRVKNIDLSGFNFGQLNVGDMFFFGDSGEHAIYIKINPEISKCDTFHCNAVGIQDGSTIWIENHWKVINFKGNLTIE